MSCLHQNSRRAIALAFFSFKVLKMGRRGSRDVHTGCAEGKVIETDLTSPIGDLRLRNCSCGIHSLEFVDRNPEVPAPQPKTRVELVKSGSVDPGCSPASIGDAVLESCVKWLDSYFHEEPGWVSTTETPPICWGSSETPEHETFVRKCLKTLPSAAGFGQVISYTDLALAVGNEKASRAAGSAMRLNPIAILIPCHRVITKGGDMGNYNGGTWRKSWLLRHEGRQEF